MGESGMDILYWIIISIFIALAFAGLVYPIIPSVVFMAGAFILYGLFFSFEPLSWIFWTVQSMFFILMLVADYAVNMLGVRRFGGSKAGVWGSTAGLIAGPFIIPFLGIIIGPFLGAVLGELAVNRTPLRKALLIGWGSVLGFIGSAAVKGAILAAMAIYFIFLVWP